MQVRAATAQDASGIVALHRASNPFGEWYRNPLQKLGRTRYEDLTPLERYLHGGFWMDLSLYRRHFHEYRRRGFPVLVAEEKGRIVGDCEVWLDEEPAPFGRYAGIEMLERASETSAEVAVELVRQAGGRVSKMGYGALDMVPEHGGDPAVAEELPFAPLWTTRTFDAVTKSVPRPGAEFETRYLAGEYGDLALMLAMNHREPSRWRFETLSALWPAAEVAGLGDAQKIVGMAVETGGHRFTVLAARREWLEPGLTEIDLWLPPQDLAEEASVRAAFAIGVEVSRRLGTKAVRTYAPPEAAAVLGGLGFTDGPDAPWLRWTF